MNARRTSLLIVDDDADLRQELAEQLDLQDFSVEQAANATQGAALAREGRAQLMIFDVHLPDGDGRDMCRALRADGVKTPIILLTGAEDEKDMVRGLDAGANDYVTKPFKFSVLLARVRAHLRVHENSEDAMFQVGPYEFRPAGKTLTDSAQKRIRLTDKETSILKYLYRAGKKTVSRDELLREVWGYNAAVTTHTLETHVYRLRQKIEPDSENPSILLTDAGGYRLQP